MEPAKGCTVGSDDRASYDKRMHSNAGRNTARMGSTLRVGRAAARAATLAAIVLTAGWGSTEVFAQAAPPAGAQQQQQQPELSRPDQTFNDWKVRCERAPNGGERCYMFQVLVRSESRDPILHIAIGRSQPGAQPVALLTLPLGVILPPGVTVQVDGGVSKKVPWEICARAGCRAAVPVDQSLLQAMRAGSRAMVGFVGPDRNEHELPVSLSGFTAAFNALP